MREPMRSAIRPVLVFALLLLPMLAWGQEARRLQKMRIGTTGRAMFSLPFIVGVNNGFYRSEGLDAELIVVAPSVAIQALISGDLDFATTFSSSTRAAMSGMPIRNVMVAMTASDQVLVVKPEIRRIEDLKGKVLGVSTLKSTTDVSTRIALKHYGLAPDVDVKIVPLGGGTGLRFTALQSGRVDGALLAMPHNKVAVKQGFRELIYMRDLIRIPFVGLAANTRRIQTDPDFIVRTIRASLRATRYIKENKSEILKLLAKEFGIKDGEVAGLVYDDAVNLYSDTGIPTDASMMEDIAAAKETQGITRNVAISEVADWSFARESAKGIR